jgi:hypothetical protein
MNSRSKKNKTNNKRSGTRRKKRKIKKTHSPLIKRAQSKPKKTKRAPKKLSEKEQAKRRRIQTMKRDAERYALIDFHTNTKGNQEFVLMNLKENKTRKVSLSFFHEVSCSCIDFRIRCKRLKISCKHILYVLDRIMKLKMNVVSNLKVKKKEEFYKVLEKIKKKFLEEADEKFKVKEDKDIQDDDVCPICYTEFDKETVDETTLQCPDCANLVHWDCMKLWLANASRKTCVYCRSNKWSQLKL